MSSKTFYRVCGDRTGTGVTKFGYARNEEAILAEQVLRRAIFSDIEFAFRETDDYGISRFSDGSWPVLYTAEDLKTPLCEAGFHFINTCREEASDNKSKSNFKANKIRYSVSVDTKSQKRLRNSSRLTAPQKKNYDYCHDIARIARNEGYLMLSAPSARNKAGKCAPVFYDIALDFSSVSGTKFQMLYNISNDFLTCNFNRKVERVLIWQSDY